MQIYRGMDIGTGKLPASERRVPHHGFDLVDPGEPYSAALFQAFARHCFRDIDARGKRAVLCGGTGQYAQAAIDDFAFPKGDQVENPVRERWTAYAEEHGNQALWEALEARDPASAAVIHPNNVRRVVRAFELLEEGASYAEQKQRLATALWEALEARDPASAAVIHPNNVRRVVRAFELLEEGASYAEQKQRLATVAPFVPAVQFGLAVEPAILNERIDARVDAMVAAGLVDEVRGLLAAGFRDGVTAPQAIGYKEIVEALDGNITLEEAVQAIKTATRRYGKRQRTWFRRDKRIRWVNADVGDAEAVAAEILSQLETLDAYHG